MPHSRTKQEQYDDELEGVFVSILSVIDAFQSRRRKTTDKLSRGELEGQFKAAYFKIKQNNEWLLEEN